MENTINQNRYSANGLSAKIQIQDKYGANVTKEWLENAAPFDAALLRAAPELKIIADQIFPDILKAIEQDGRIKKTKTAKSRSRIKETCKAILYNLYVAYLTGIPVRYSRRISNYAKARRYGQLFFKYYRLIGTVKAFNSLGLIHQKAGRYDREKSLGRQARMWASEKLVSLFNDFTHGLPCQVYPADREELVVLKNSNKVVIDYTDSAVTNSLRNNLARYNEFISGEQLKVSSDGNRKVSLRNLSHDMLLSLFKGDASIVNFKLLNNDKYHSRYNSNTTDSSTTNIVDTNIIDTNNNILYNYTNNNSISITGSFFNSHQEALFYDEAEKFKYDDWFFSRTKCLVPSMVRQNDKTFVRNGEVQHCLLEQGDVDDSLNHLSVFTKYIRGNMIAHGKNPDFINEKSTLSNLGISQLDFIINSKKLYRVFNESSFELGGRFYGALYQTMPKGFRKDILIGGESTVELDYAAYHTRILYHLLGMDYREDPYRALTDDPEWRPIFKKLLFVAINAKTEMNAVFGFKKACNASGKKMPFALTHKSICRLLEKVREKHPGISEFIHSGHGLKLQNLDSEITEAILMRMTDKGIPCLPVHDSYIVPRQFENELRVAMVDEYQSLLKFEPVIG